MGYLLPLPFLLLVCVCAWRLFSSRTRKRSRRKTREPYVPVVGDDVVKPVLRPVSRSHRLDDVIYPSLLLDDCPCPARAAACHGYQRPPSTSQRYACAVYAVVACLSVRPSVTSRSSTKIAKRRIMLTAPYNSPGSLVFLCQRCPRNSTWVTPYTGAPNAGGIGNNRRLSTNDSLYLGLLLLWPLLLTRLYVRLLRVCSISLNTQILKSGKRYKIDA